jgi:hypothetical protein
VEVLDIHAATERALALGATLLLEPREGPAGFRSVVATRSGGELALWQFKRGRAAMSLRQSGRLNQRTSPTTNGEPT